LAVANAQKIPDTIVDAKKKQVKFELDKYLEEVKDNGAELTPERIAAEKKVYTAVQRSTAKAFKEAGITSEATVTAKNKAIRKIMDEVFEGMNESNFLDNYSPDERWKRYTSFDNVDAFRKSSLEDEFYSAEVMKFLSKEERVMLSFYTEGGDRFTMYGLYQERGGKAEEAIRKYCKAISLIYDSLDSYVERKPVKVYRGVGATAKLTDKKNPDVPTTFGKMLLDFKPGQKNVFQLQAQTSFSSNKDIAVFFAGSSTTSNSKVVLNLVSNRGAPISSISAISSEDEHLMRPGEKYRILSVRKEKKSIVPLYNVNIEHVLDDTPAEYEFKL
jgi:hypothetical protein